MNTLATSNGDVEQHSTEIRNEQTEEMKQEEEEGTAGLTEGQREKKRMMNRMAGQKKPIDTVKRRKGERLVDDPVTGQKVVIKDAQFKGTFLSCAGQIHSYLRLSDFPTQQQLDPKTGKAGPALTSIAGAASKAFHPSRTAPNPAYPSNISLQPFPPSTPPSLQPVLSQLMYLQYGIMASAALLWFLLAFGHGFWAFLWRSTIIGGLAFVGATVASLAERKLEREMERVRFDMHRQREYLPSLAQITSDRRDVGGETFAPPTPESVEWLNAFTKVIWGLINPDMFVPIGGSLVNPYMTL